MSFLRKIFGGGTSGDNAMYFYIRCNQCQEAIRIRVNPGNDLSPVFEEDSDQPVGYELSKEIMGNKCFNLMRGTWQFDRSRHVTGSEISGGKEITREEFEAETTARTE